MRTDSITSHCELGIGVALLPAKGLDDGFLGLCDGWAVRIILAQLGINALGIFHIFQAAHGDDLS